MDGGLTVLNIVAAGVAVALGLFLLLNEGRDRLRTLFALLNLTTAAWIFSNDFGNSEAYALVVIDYATGACLALLFWLFSCEMRQRALGSAFSSVYTKNLAMIAAYATISILLALILSGGIINLRQEPTLMIGNGIFYAAYPIIIFVLAAFSLNNLLKAYVRSRNSIQKMRAKFVLLGLLIAFIGIVIPNLVLQNILPEDSILLVASYELAYLGILAFLGLSTYGIIKHGLFDIKLAAVRSAAYILAIVTLSVIYYLSAYVFTAVLFRENVTTDVSVSPFNFILALVLALLFQPLKKFFDKVTNSIFYRENYKSEDFFGTLSDLLSSTTELRGLLERAAKEIAKTLKAEQGLFFVYYKNGVQHHLSAGTGGHAKLPIHDARMLDFYVDNMDGKILITDMLPDEDEQLRRMLVSHKVSLVMPLWHSGQPMGYLLLGDRLSGNYTKRDLQVLQALSNELVIAVQNALSLHELKELNATLQQRINVATKELRSSNAQLKHLDQIKDEFISMASHQLRTPLTSVKGYISLVLDGDAGNVTPRQQKLLLEAFNSSERMVRLIADFLNVSRLQTGRFIVDKKLVDLKDLIEQEVSDLKLIAKTHKINLKLDITKEPTIVRADEGKIHQVVMNFIDNAIYYSRKNGTVIVRLERVSKTAALTVVDTGIGVPEAEQGKLFNKFFRARNARKQRPDGTGVGLYMARRVIEAHDGKLIFSSKEGKGSTFGFSMPLVGDSE